LVTLQWKRGQVKERRRGIGEWSGGAKDSGGPRRLYKAPSFNRENFTLTRRKGKVGPKEFQSGASALLQTEKKENSPSKEGRSLEKRQKKKANT